MGSKLVRFIACFALFVVSFVLFLYWFFPYDILKDRITGMIEQQAGGLEVSINKLEPYWLTGVEVEGFSIGEPGGDRSKALIECRRVRARASLFSLIFGNPHVSFDVELGEGEISGTVKQTEEALAIDAEMNDVDLGNLKLIGARTGLSIGSRIDGEVSLYIDRQRPLRSTGKVSLTLADMHIAASEVKLGEMTLPLPDLVISKGRESQIKLDVGKGTVSVENFKLAGGDLVLDLKGKIFLSTKLENYRFNLNGSFLPSKKLADALPFLFIIEQQKQEDGSYPITITGRLEKPSIKIGTFTVPL